MHWQHEANKGFVSWSSDSLAATNLGSCNSLAQKYYCKTSNISRTFVGNNIVDNSDVVGASPVGAAPTTSSFST